MRKKSHHHVPDFSRHPARQASAVAPSASAKPAPPAPRATAKPRATSAKSGRRGQ